MDKQLFYVVNNKGVIAFNLLTGEQTSQTVFKSDISRLDTLMDAKIDREHNYLYVVRGLFMADTTTPALTRFEQINLTSGVSTIIYERRTIVRLFLSPDGAQAIIFYYLGKVGRSPINICVLSIAKGSCSQIHLQVPFSSAIYWLDNSVVLVSIGGSKLYSVNTNTQKVTLLSGFRNWYIEAITVIPQTRSLLIAAHPMKPPDRKIDPDHLLIYEPDTGRLNDYPYQMPSTDASSIQPNLSFSPNGDYFVIDRSVSSQIVDFKTGRVITELKNAIQIVWPLDSRYVLVYALKVETNYTVTPQILRLDLQTGLSTSLYIATMNTIVIA